MHDTLTDLVCDAVPYTFLGEEGFIHKGFQKCGERMCVALGPMINELIRR